MKKILVALTLALTIGNANAVPVMTRPSHPIPHNSGYDIGYHKGKNDAYNNVARTVVIAGFVIAASVIIYEIGANSRWTTNEKGVVYRF